jgi:alkylhydroperoxidase family enzyme
MDHPSSPRIAPLTPDEQSDVQRELLAGTPPLNIFATLVRHPGMYRRWAPFGGKLLAGAKLPPRDREIVILRTAFRCGASYEWGQHVQIARDAGLTDDDIRRVAAGADADGWADGDDVVVRAVDQLTDDHCIDDATWAQLAERFDEQQLIELPVLSGHYAMLAGALNSYGVQPERVLPALGET